MLVTNYLMKKLFTIADKDHSNSLDFKETLNLLRSMHIKANGNYVKKLFLKYDENGNKTIEFDEFQLILSELLFKKELAPVYKKYCKSA